MPNEIPVDLPDDAADDAVRETPHYHAEHVIPRLNFGSSVELEDGLTIAVLGIEQYEGESTRPGHVVVRARIANLTDAPLRFENDLGVVESTGEAHRFSWVNPSRFPGTLPGVANLEPGDAIEGESHVFVPADVDVDISSLSASVVMAALDGCAGCDQTLTFHPRVIWSDSEPAGEATDDLTP